MAAEPRITYHRLRSSNLLAAGMSANGHLGIIFHKGGAPTSEYVYEPRDGYLRLFADLLTLKSAGARLAVAKANQELGPFDMRGTGEDATPGAKEFLEREVGGAPLVSRDAMLDRARALRAAAEALEAVARELEHLGASL